MISGEDDPVFFGIGLKEASLGAAGNDDAGGRRGFNKPERGADRHEAD